MIGLPIDEYPMPDEYEALFSNDQVDNLLDRTRWVMLVRKAPKPIMRSSHKAVCFVLFTYVVGKRTSTCWPSQRTLASDTGLSERTVWEALANLEADGWIERVSRGRRTSEEISLCWPPYRSVQSGTHCGTQSRSHCDSQTPSPATDAASPATGSTSPATDAASPAPVAAEGEVKGFQKVQYMASEPSSDLIADLPGNYIAAMREDLASKGKGAKRGAA